MRKVKALLDFEALSEDYAQYHTHPGNRLCHAVGIPLIMLCVVRWTQWPEVSLFPGAGLALILYAVWSAPLALAMTAVVLGMAAAAPYLPQAAVWSCFIVGWIFQFLGHYLYEGRSPAFTRNLAHLLVGPMWILREHLDPAGRLATVKSE